MTTALLSVRNLVKHYHRPGLLGALASAAPAVDGASLEVREGEVLGLIGESGCGKTTLVRTALGLLRSDGGQIHLLGQDLATLQPRGLHALRRNAQLLVQNPDASLNPGLRVSALLRESARLHRAGDDPEAVARAAAARVGLAERFDAWPHELSGGEKRRVGIARLMMASPRLTVADEPTAGLDAALKAEIVDLLLGARDASRGYLIISHDLPMVLYACNRVSVMYAGRILEEVGVPDLGRVAHHPYTDALLSAGGIATPERSPLRQRSQGRFSPGCVWLGPCPWADPRCQTQRPVLRPARGGEAHRMACHVRALEGSPL